MNSPIRRVAANESESQVVQDFDESTPGFQVRMLAMRVDTLTKQKEEIESGMRDERSERKLLDVRVAKMEKSFQRGAGMMIMMPVIGTLIGILIAYGKYIFGNGK